MDILKLHQIITEDKYSKYNVNKHISDAVSDTLLRRVQDVLTTWYERDQVTETLEEISIKVAITLYAVGKSELLTTAAGRIGALFNVSIPQGVVYALEILGILDSKSDLIHIYLSGSHLAFTTSVKLDKKVAQAVAVASCLPPFICQPNEVTHTYNSGHLSVCKKLLLGKYANSKNPTNLHFINMANSIQFSLNTEALEYTEEPKNVINNSKDRDAFNNMVATSDVAYEYIMDAGNKFYLSHNYDSRGREYSDNWQINYQGSDYKKSIVSLAHKEVIQ